MNNLFVGDANRYANGNGLVGISSTAGMQRLNVSDAAAQFEAGLSIEDKQFLANIKGSKYRADAIDNRSLFFNRALEYLTAKAYEVEYEVLPFRQIFDVVNEGGAGVKEIVSEVYDFFAKAQPINAAGKDIPFVAGGGKEIKYPVIMWGIGAQWTMQELQEFVVAQRNGRGRYSPQQIRQAAAIRGLEDALNDQALFGTAGTGITGALNHPLVPTGPVAQGTAKSTNWDTKTPDEILADIQDIGDTIYVHSKMREKPNKLLLPPSKWSLLKNRRLGDYSNMSLLTYVITNSQYFTSPEDIIPINELENAGEGGTGKMVAYCKNPDKICVEIPQEAEAMPVQQQLFTYMSLWYAYSGGAVIRYPRSMAYREGI